MHYICQSVAARKSEPRSSQTRGVRTREKILDAVLELVGLEGPSAVTYRAVADRAGVGQGVMTYHFASRRELLSAAVQLHLERLRTNATELPVAQARNLLAAEKSRFIFAFLRKMVREDRVRHLAEFEITLELARDPELRKQVVPESETTRVFARELLSQAGSANPDVDAILISAAMDGLLLYWLARPDDRAHERRIRKAVDRMIELFFPDDASSREKPS